MHQKNTLLILLIDLFFVTTYFSCNHKMITYDEWKYDGNGDVNENYSEGDHGQDHRKTKRMARKVRPSFVGRTALSSDLVRKEGMR